LAAAAASGVPRCEYEVLERKLLGLATGSRKLYFTGHSIGAGLAAVFPQALHARCSCTLTQPLAL
jgi:Lipase (class 3)